MVLHNVNLPNTLSYVIVVKSVSHVQLFVTAWTAAHQVPLSSAMSWSLLKFKSIDLVKLSNHLTLCCPLLLLALGHTL